MNKILLSSLDVIISLESRIVLYNIVSCIHEGIAKYAGASLGHTGLLSLEVSRRINRRIQSGVRREK